MHQAQYLIRQNMIEIAVNHTELGYGLWERSISSSNPRDEKDILELQIKE